MSSDYKKLIVLALGLILIFLWFRFASPKQATPLPQVPATAVEADSYTLIIPKLSVSAPILFADSSDEAQIQTDLQSGIVHLKDTAMPGEIGNAYIVGHSSDYQKSPGNFKTVFAKLPDLVIGDEVIVQHNENQLRFKVTATKIVEATDLSVLSQDTGGKPMLTLQTSYPIGTAQKRYIVSCIFLGL